jgi:hypothetical protein
MTKKTPTVKKKPATGVKKKPVKKKTDNVRLSLAKELISLVPKLDSEGLAFLIKQARIHQYNMQINELGKAARAVDTASARSKAIKGLTKKPSSKTAIKIDATGTGYYLRYSNSGVILSKDEMVQLVKLVNSSSSQTEIGNRLFNWFYNERRDIFQLIPIADKNDKILVNIAEVIKKNFKLKN